MNCKQILLTGSFVYLSACGVKEKHRVHQTGEDAKKQKTVFQGCYVPEAENSPELRGAVCYEVDNTAVDPVKCRASGGVIMESCPEENRVARCGETVSNTGSNLNTKISFYDGWDSGICKELKKSGFQLPKSNTPKKQRR